MNNEYKLYSRIYTDGSKDEVGVGCGVIGVDFIIEGQLPSSSSVFSAEAAALAIAVYHADNTPTVILTDSASCLSALEKGNILHPYIQAIETFSENKHVVFLWIPGHCDISGNVKADQAAKRGRTGLALEFEVPAKDLILWAKHKMKDIVQSRWIGNTTDQLALVKRSIGKWNDKMKKSDQRVLTRCRIGHTRLTKCHLFSKNDPDICDLCNSSLDVKHILLECRKFDDIRRRLGISSNISIALSNDQKEENKIIKYLKNTGLYNQL